ncbi:unnamed protein product [Didymodactylos carnosus]|uniref:EGF-like domain-containing protein n=1 Tax=Didymodactylos carnosus TaxID=1234261 RepID=A0A8S2FCF1_9BILA|nr:unnamed protein product [Didymodactylos carnosus]CAF4221946.1 unnamed protein product [Didymodactylos carnosus]
MYNVQGLSSKLAEVQYLLDLKHPTVLVYVETGNTPLKLLPSYFPPYRRYFTAGTNAHGGVLILVHTSVPSKSVHTEPNILDVEVSLRCCRLNLDSLCSILPLVPMHLVPLPNLTGFVFCIGGGFGIEQKCADGAYYDPIKKECNDSITNVASVNSPCSSSPCNGGNCVNIFAASTYYCMCHNGLYTRHCEHKHSYCEDLRDCGRGHSEWEISKGCQLFDPDKDALKYICFCRPPKSSSRTVEQFWYGLSCMETIFEAPCATAIDGEKFPLRHTDKGYLRCLDNGTSASFESCLIDYVWNDAKKTCVSNKGQ